MSKDYAYGVWHSVDESMPLLEIDEYSLFETSERVIIHGKDGCIWLAFWDGEVWRNANTPDKIWFNKKYVTAWFRIPAFHPKRR